jgi:hypothetical protein
MKFVSKLLKLRVVLKQGLPGNRQLGTPSISMLSVLFENGMAEVNNQEMIDLMMKHPGCKKNSEDKIFEFMPLSEDGKDPFAGNRPDVEPLHTMTNIDYGHLGKSINVKKPVVLSSDQMELVKKLAADMATELFKKMVDEQNKPSSVLPPSPNSFPQNANSTLNANIVYEKPSIINNDPLEGFSRLAPEPCEDVGDKVYVDEEPTVAPPIKKNESVADKAEEIKEELVVEENKPKRGRPPVKKE